MEGDTWSITLSQKREHLVLLRVWAARPTSGKNRKTMRDTKKDAFGEQTNMVIVAMVFFSFIPFASGCQRRKQALRNSTGVAVAGVSAQLFQQAFDPEP